MEEEKVNEPEAEIGEVTASEPVAVIDEATVSSSEEVV